MGFKFSILPSSQKAKKEIALAVLSGVLLGFAYPPFPFFFLAFFALVPFFTVISNRNGLAETNRITYVFAFAFNLITLYWVGSWTKEADPFLMISGVALLFFNPLLFLVPSSLFVLAKKYFSKRTAFLLFPFFWVSYEYLYSVTEFRFPWLTLGNSQAYFTPFIQIADILGVYGISLIVLFANVFLFFGTENYVKRKRKIEWKFVGVASLFLFLPLLYGGFFAPDSFEGKEIKIGIVQPNLNPWKKWDAGSLDEQIDLYFELAAETIEKGAQIVVFPETALPVYLTAPSNYKALNRFYEFVDSFNVPILTGMPDLNIFPESKAPEHAKSFKHGSRKYTTYNAVYLFTPGTKKIEEYHKVKLVPFGEKVPYVEYVPFLGKLLKWEVGISSWNVGDGAKVLETKISGEPVKLGAGICIESIYPEYIAKFVKQNAEILFIVTNDSWYGKSSGPYQHEAIAILRAVENRRYVVRAANGGISCIISPRGKITQETELFTRTTLTGNAKLLREQTFYTRFPLVIPVTSVLIALLVLAGAIIKKSGSQKPDFN